MYNTIVCDPHFKGFIIVVVVVVVVVFKILQRCVYTCPSIHACAHKSMQAQTDAQIHRHGLPQTHTM